ncbi:adiponectin receptor protein [Stylonychia lemnae]|uniref:Adiponectin receptor protein n=1 Tax=Stylonychia lemnae TaxID=5949 RepID=A0A078AAK7_STYLE|nr:adiponectin receptor protein [Stylonychia lemnae]|eukprot:CDW79249.1 adiponectin receptor protein [Stylonychia lemnae]
MTDRAQSSESSFISSNYQTSDTQQKNALNPKQNAQSGNNQYYNQTNDQDSIAKKSELYSVKNRNENLIKEKLRQGDVINAADQDAYDPKQKSVDLKVRLPSEEETPHEKEGFIGGVDDAAPFQKDKYLQRGYRVGFKNKRSLAKTFFWVHNESVNVWTHTIGVAIFVFLIYNTVMNLAPPNIYNNSQGVQTKPWTANIQDIISQLQSGLAQQIQVSNLNDKQNYEELQNQSKSDETSTQISSSTQNQQEKQESAIELKHDNKLKIKIQIDPVAQITNALHQPFFEEIQKQHLCINTLKTFAQVLDKIHSSLDSQVNHAISKIKGDEINPELIIPKVNLFNHNFFLQIGHISKLTQLLKIKVNKWQEEITAIKDDSQFNWEEIKPIVTQPEKFLNYVTRGKFQIILNKGALNLLVVPLFIFMASAIVCMGCSAFYHLFKDVSPLTKKLLQRMDYCGISLLIAGSNTPPIYYSFYCDEVHFWRNCYLGLMYGSCWAGFILLLVPKFDQNKYRKWRAASFVFAGLMSCVPAVHAMNLDPKYVVDFNEWKWAIGGAIYIFGAGLYASKFPEKWYPGKFDIFGSSHQLFHVLIVTAALVHYKGAIENFHLRQLSTCPVDYHQSF